jgi:CDP-paratose 2-epimerase
LKVLVTGSSGLIGSEAVRFYDRAGHDVIGIDNNMRREFFGAMGDTTWNLRQLQQTTKRFRHFPTDIRDRTALQELFHAHQFQAVIHCAAQPSHDKAADDPIVDFDVNAVGTLNLLEATRKSAPEAAFVFMSTNKVYGDAPNEIPLIEKTTRWEYRDQSDFLGVTEECRIDRSLHSLFGASKASADLLAQEYGRYFGMAVGVFRGGCLTGPAHSAVELHGFLAYVVKAVALGLPYVIYGYKGKQVRDQIHSSDVISAFDAFITAPRCGEVYNLGGGRDCNVSVLEAIDAVEGLTGRSLARTYIDEPRRGDHVCYISNMTKFREHYPSWTTTRRLNDIIEEMVRAARSEAPQA